MTQGPGIPSDDYAGPPLPESVDAPHPCVFFDQWFHEALAGGGLSPNAMTLATVDHRGRPRARIVLMKDFNQDGFFTFYTNYSSAKGRELLSCPFAALVFFWPSLFRQVRIEGRVQLLSEEQSDSYFSSRSRFSQVSALISPQSQAIPNRQWLVDQCYAFQRVHFEKISRPSFWGGFVLSADSIEFWQGQASRLHDRLYYTRSGSSWLVERLAP